MLGLLLELILTFFVSKELARSILLKALMIVALMSKKVIFDSDARYSWTISSLLLSIISVIN